MFFRQVLHRDLGCASYVLGDSGAAIVVDPRFDIEVYVGIARDEGLAITHVVDTHDHADHLSGRVRLAGLVGARAYRPARTDGSHPDDLQPGAELRIGRLSVRALPTPGHRPEHLSLTVSDLSRSSDPWLVLTGDSLLVGDLARPDLVVTPEVGARELHASLRDLLALGDHVEVWPAHVGGSLCGGAGLSGKTCSTIGYERRNNRLLSQPEPEFVDGLTTSIPDRPPNLERIVELNRRSRLDIPPAPPVVGPRELLGLVRGEVTVLDAREPRTFDESHIAGAVNLPVSASALGTRAGWALRPHEPIVIVAADAAQADAMTRALHAVGLWRILAVALRWDGLPVVSEHSWDLQTLAGGLHQETVELIDVREDREWQAGHVSGSTHLSLARIGNGRDLVAPAREATIAIACAAGVRAAFAASLLRRGGWRRVVRVAGGGVPDLAAHGIPMVGGPA